MATAQPDLRVRPTTTAGLTRGLEISSSILSRRMPGFDTDLDRKLLTACKANNVEEVTAFLKDGADAKYEDEKHWSPLIWAVINGNEQLCKILLEREAAARFTEAHAQQQQQQRRPYTAPALMVRGPQGGQAGPLPTVNPLHWAAFKGRLRILWMLLAAGMQIDAQDPIGMTPLHHGAAGGSADIVSCLLSQGADSTKRNKRGHTPKAVCTDPACLQLLKSAEETTHCSNCESTLIFPVIRLLCSHCRKFFCDRCCVRYNVFSRADSAVKEKPVTQCHECHDLTAKAEGRLVEAMELQDVKAVEMALKEIADGQVEASPKIIMQGQRTLVRIRAEMALTESLKNKGSSSVEVLQKIIQKVEEKIDEATLADADSSLLARARNYVRRLVAEKDLRVYMFRKDEYSQDTMDGMRILIERARRVAASEELLAVADVWLHKVDLARLLLERLAEAARCEPRSRPSVLEQQLQADSASPGPDAQEPHISPPDWFQHVSAFEAWLHEFDSLMKNSAEEGVDETVLKRARNCQIRMRALLEERQAAEEASKSRKKKKAAGGKKGAKKKK